MFCCSQLHLTFPMYLLCSTCTQVHLFSICPFLLFVSHLHNCVRGGLFKSIECHPTLKRCSNFYSANLVEAFVVILSASPILKHLSYDCKHLEFQIWVNLCVSYTPPPSSNTSNSILYRTSEVSVFVFVNYDSDSAIFGCPCTPSAASRANIFGLVHTLKIFFFILWYFNFTSFLNVREKFDSHRLPFFCLDCLPRFFRLVCNCLPMPSGATYDNHRWFMTVVTRLTVVCSPDDTSPVRRFRFMGQ